MFVIDTIPVDSLVREVSDDVSGQVQNTGLGDFDKIVDKTMVLSNTFKVHDFLLHHELDLLLRDWRFLGHYLTELKMDLL